MKNEHDKQCGALRAALVYNADSKIVIMVIQKNPILHNPHIAKAKNFIRFITK